MAKETTIIFLYDTELLKREEDDPNSAILYFYPTWVSDQQKTALCGQLMGTVMCLRSILAMPKTVHIQTGKFYLVENGRYILVVGTDRNIPDWVLEHRTSLLYSLVNFFHKDFVTLSQHYDKENFSVKLYHIFDTYLKLLFLGGCMFSHMPLWNFSKTDSDILINARIFLDKSKATPNFLGGMLLYHNKVIYSQLSAQTSRMVVFSDPFRIKNPAELNAEVSQTVKLLHVYIPGEEFEDLIKDCVKLKVLDNKNSENRRTEPNNCAKSDAASSSVLKRDTPLLFTAVPEDAAFSPRKEGPKKSQNKKSRPNSLNLKSCSLDSVGDPYLRNRNSPITTPYWSQTSLVSTPISETKSFVDQPDTRMNKEHIWKLSLGFHKVNLGQDPQVPNLPGEGSQYYQTICFPRPLEVYSRRLEKAERLSTFVQAALEKAFVYRTISLKNLSQTNSISNTLNQYSNFRNKTKRSISSLKRWNSIHDPLYPWCKGGTIAASQYYIEEVLDEEFFVGRNRREESTFRELITERKRSLTLPIKPHNASEAQKSDTRSPGTGYRTPLMNKLSMLRQELPVAPFVSRDENGKTGKTCELQKCLLFMYGEGDMVLATLLLEECSQDKKTIDKLQQLCAEHLPTLEKQIKSSIKPPGTTESTQSEPYSIASVDAAWGTSKRSGPWHGQNLDDLRRLHGDFTQHSDVDQIYLRRPESVLFGHRDGATEVFYHEAAPLSDGLLPPHDALGAVHQTAKKKLEKNHDVFIK